MTYEELQDQIKVLLKKYDEEGKKSGTPYISQIEEKFETYLNKNPKDTKVWFLFSEFEHWYLHDTYKSQELLLEILKYEPNNIYAALIFGYMSLTLLHLDQDLAFQNLQALKTNDPELLSMIEYIKAFYYLNDKATSEEFLKKSIEYCDKHVNNYIDLGRFYGEKTEEGKKLIKKGLDNVKSLFIYFPTMKYESKLGTKEDFINEFITGTSFHGDTYKSMLKALKSS